MNKQIKTASAVLLWILAVLLVVHIAFNMCVPFAEGAERIGGNEGELYRASCRIFNGNTAGSGVIFHQDEFGNLYVLTNYHVAGKNDCKVHLFTKGAVYSVEGTNIWQGFSNAESLDAVVLKLSASSVASVTNDLFFVPFLNNGEELAGEEEMFTAGAPKAQWLSERQGTIKFNGSGNCTFKPTPYGGQSGSGICIKKNGAFYVGALLTWRTDEEGTETWGGLGQPITRIIKAIETGENASFGDSLPDCELPQNAIPCPGEVEEKNVIEIEDQGEKIKVVPCASSNEVYIEFWECANCSYCEQAKKTWVPEFEKKTKVVVLNGSGKNADYARKIGISSYPTVRVINKGVQYSLYTGFAEVNYNSIMFDLSKLIPVYTKDKPEEETKPEAENSEEGLDCLDNTCRLLNNQEKQDQNSQTKSGSLPFKLPKNGTGKKPEEKPGILEKILPKEAPQEQQKAPEDKNGGLFNWKGKLNKEFDDKLNDIENRLKNEGKKIIMGSFWVCFFACTLALATYKTTCQVFRCLWWCIKKIFGSVTGKIENAFSTFSVKLAEKVAEISKEQNKTNKEK